MCSPSDLLIFRMWLLPLFFKFILFIQPGSFASESPPLPQPSTSAPVFPSPTRMYLQSSPHPVPGTDMIGTSPTPSQMQGQVKETIAANTTGVTPPCFPCTRKSQPKHPAHTVLELHSTDAMPSPSVSPLLTSNTTVYHPTSEPQQEAPCFNDRYYSCRRTNPLGCRCDELCKRFGDCCSDSNHNHDANITNFECMSNIVLKERLSIPNDTHYYWMIASCPKEESDSGTLNEMSVQCESPSLISPPITDNRTGLVYRNVHCAQCNRVPKEKQITWKSKWLCDGSNMRIFNSSNETVDNFLAQCNPAVFKEPRSFTDKDRLYPLRKCDGHIIYKCQPPAETNTSSKGYDTLERLCRNKPGKARRSSTASGIYKNKYCALCSSPLMNESILRCPPDPGSGSTGVEIPIFSFTLLLDVTGTGNIALSSETLQVTVTIQQFCAEGKIFDVYRKKCRESPCQNVTVQGYNSEGNPLDCTNFTRNFTSEVNVTINRPLYGYPETFGILSCLGLSVDVVAATILLFTYAAFSEMRTFYGKLFMNFVLVLLLGDLTFLLGTAVYAVSREDVVCQVVAILLHYLFLARFVWMSLLSLNAARHFYHAANFIVSEKRESWHYLILYMAAGWLSPLLVLLVTVPLNYAIPGTVGYGVNGRCWMNQTLAIIVSFVVPLAICFLFTTGAFIFVCIVLVKMRGSDMTKDRKPKTSSRNCRVLAAVFCVTGAMWLFGFLAMIHSALSWAWYIFIMLNTTQAVFLTLAYICTAKVLRLYRNALKRRFWPH